MTALRKASGELEEFEDDKLRRSLRASGVSPRSAERVVTKVHRKLPTKSDTREVFRLVHRQLRAIEPASAARYNLRHGIMQLGPTGYPFERFLRAVLEREGFQSETSQILVGASGVKHEIDVVATSEHERVFVECKFRRHRERKCDVKVAMYVSARARDLLGELKGRDDQAFWLVTNTKFTSDAERFGESTGLTMLSWDYPRQGRRAGGLRRLVEDGGLFPITCLSSLDGARKRALVARGVVLVSELSGRTDLLADLGTSRRDRASVQREIDALSMTISRASEPRVPATP